jgi:hypothetical protein
MGGAPTPLYWPAASFPLRYRTDSKLAASIGQQTIDRGFEAWTKISGTSISFVSLGAEDGVAAGQDGKNSISGLEGLFNDQGFIAVTTYWNDSSGRMSEADVQLDTRYVGTTYPAQQTIEHEVGHLLGLDHSGVLSSVMYPYISQGSTGAFDTDDKVSAATLYPKIDPTLTGATLTGRVVSSSGGVFGAQVVALNDQGEPVVTTLTDASGGFTLEAVPAGTYRVYAEPLDGPVTPQNFAGVYGEAKSRSFPTRFIAGQPFPIDAGKVYGNLTIDTNGAPVQLNPKWIGATEGESSSFSLYSSVVNVRPGETVTIAVGGDGFTSSMTTFSVLNPGVKRISDFHSAANYVYATFQIAPDVRPGSSVVMVTSGSESAALTGGVRIDSAPPTAAGKTRLVRR